MSQPITWRERARDGAARTGILQTPHGEVRTPAFMPVGTRAAVKAVDVDDLRDVGAEIVLANTYHLMLRPGEEVVSGLGGLHGFMGWEDPILTDSGGFQVFSLSPEIDQEGATFKSVYDGETVRLTPERAVAAQEALGADIAMALDVCLPLPAPRRQVEEAMETTLRWAERSRSAHRREDQGLFGIVQGGTDDELRHRSAQATAEIGFPGYGIGGLSVGESGPERNRALEAAFEGLPGGSPRYVMGLGDTEGLLDAIERGADMFDCVLPTRLARHGKALTRLGDLNLKNAAFVTDGRPVDADCGCHTCRSHSRAYLAHLVRMKEISAGRLLAIHNLRYTLDLVSGAATAIAAGRFNDYARSARSGRDGGSAKGTRDP